MKPIILFFKTPKKVSSRPVRKMVLFFKAQQFQNQPGYILHNRRWHSMLPEWLGGGGVSCAKLPITKQNVQQWLALHAADWRELAYTAADWHAEFGEPPHVSTPIGIIKLGANQFIKLADRDDGKRIRYGGLIRPTLEQPAFIIERHAPKAGAERESKLVFIRGFKEPARGLCAFTAITIQRDGLEIMISGPSGRPWPNCPMDEKRSGRVCGASRL